MRKLSYIETSSVFWNVTYWLKMLLSIDFKLAFRSQYNKWLVINIGALWPSVNRYPAHNGIHRNETPDLHPQATMQFVLLTWLCLFQMCVFCSIVAFWVKWSRKTVKKHTCVHGWNTIPYTYSLLLWLGFYVRCLMKKKQNENYFISTLWVMWIITPLLTRQTNE